MTKSVNWKRLRFLDKVFTQYEQSMILSSENRTRTLWLLWSMKEASYKIHVQEFGQRFFNPKAFRCELQSLSKGNVFTKTTKYKTNSQFNQHYIHTIASKDGYNNITASVFNVNNSSYKYQSRITKEKLLNYITASENLEHSKVKIVKNRLGIPKIVCDSEPLPITFSLSHCGHYCGFSILNN